MVYHGILCMLMFLCSIAIIYIICSTVGQSIACTSDNSVLVAYISCGLPYTLLDMLHMNVRSIAIALELKHFDKVPYTVKLTLSDNGVDMKIMLPSNIQRCICCALTTLYVLHSMVGRSIEYVHL